MTEGWIEVHTDRQMDRYTDGRTDGHTDGRTDGRTNERRDDRQTERGPYIEESSVGGKFCRTYMISDLKKV